MKKIFRIIILSFVICLSVLTTSCNASPYGRFEKISDMHVERNDERLFLLKDGKVLVFGGDTYFCNYKNRGIKYDLSKNITAEIFDPKTNTFTLKKGFNRKILNNYTATLLNNGKLLLTGGSFGSGNNEKVYNTSEIYDPETDTITEGPDMTLPREYHTAVLLKEGRVLIFRGLIGKKDNWENKTAEIYDPVQNKFIMLKNAPVDIHAGSNNTQVLSDGTVWILERYDVVNRQDNFIKFQIEIFDPKTNEFRIIKSENQHRAKGEYYYKLYKTLLLKDDRIVLFADTAMHNQIDIYDPKTDKLTNIGNTRLKDRKRFEATLLTDGNVLITGGLTGEAEGLKAVNTAEILDTKKLKFYLLPKMNSKGYAKTILLNDGRVLMPRAKTSEFFLLENKSKGE